MFVRPYICSNTEVLTTAGNKADAIGVVRTSLLHLFEIKLDSLVKTRFEEVPAI